MCFGFNLFFEFAKGSMWGLQIWIFKSKEAFPKNGRITPEAMARASAKGPSKVTPTDFTNDLDSKSNLLDAAKEMQSCHRFCQKHQACESGCLREGKTPDRVLKKQFSDKYVVGFNHSPVLHSRMPMSYSVPDHFRCASIFPEKFPAKLVDHKPALQPVVRSKVSMFKVIHILQ